MTCAVKTIRPKSVNNTPAGCVDRVTKTLEGEIMPQQTLLVSYMGLSNLLGCKGFIHIEAKLREVGIESELDTNTNGVKIWGSATPLPEKVSDHAAS